MRSDCATTGLYRWTGSQRSRSPRSPSPVVRALSGPAKERTRLLQQCRTATLACSKDKAMASPSALYEAEPQGRHTGNSKGHRGAPCVGRTEVFAWLPVRPHGPLIARFQVCFPLWVREIENDASNCRHGRGAATFAADA